MLGTKNVDSIGKKNSFGKNNELRNRILFTLFILLIYRMGTYIPIPGVNIDVIREFFTNNSRGIMGVLDMFSGGSLGRMTVFALNIIPYIAASIMMQLVVVVFPSLNELKKDSASGRKQINQYTRYLTLFVCALQSFGIAIALESMGGMDGTKAVVNAGWMFRFNTVITLMAGTFFVLWMGEKITEKGIGNGVSLIIFSGIVSNLPSALSMVFQLGEKGVLSGAFIVGLFVMIVLVIYGVVYVETAQRRLVIKYPKRQIGNKMMSGGETSYLPLKINNSGVVPPIFASSLLLMPGTVLGFLNLQGNPVVDFINLYLVRGNALYLFIYSILIVVFSFFYVFTVFNPQETADNLKKNGAIAMGMRPGVDTKNYLEFILYRLTFLGAIYLVVICLLPEILISKLSLPFYFGGTSLLIVVSVTIDTMTQVQSYLLSSKYETILKKAKLGKK